jgi:ankyrin repeat protein
LNGIFQTADRCNPFSEKFLEQVADICEKNIIFLEVGSNVKWNPDCFEKLMIVEFNDDNSKALSIKSSWFSDENIVKALSNENLLELFVRSNNKTITFVYHKRLGKVFRCALCDTDLEEQFVSEELFELAKTPGATAEEILEILGQIPLAQWKSVLARKNKNGKTLLHVVAEFENGVVFLNTVNEILPGQLFDLLGIQDIYGNIPLHVAAWSKNGAVFLETMAEFCQGNQLASLLELKNEEGNTPLHRAAEFENGVVLLKIIAKKLPEKFVNFLDMKNNYGEMPLHMAVWYAHGAVFLNEVTENLPQNQLLSLLKISDGHGRTLTHLAMRSKSGEAFLNKLVKIFPEDQWVSFLEPQDEDGRTPLHVAAWYSHGIALLEAIAKKSPRQLVNILKVLNKHDQTPLHSMAYSRNEDVQIMVKILPKDQLIALLKMKDKFNTMPLHNAAKYDNDAFLKAIIEKLSVTPLAKPLSDQLADLLEIRDPSGYIPFHWLAKAGKGVKFLETAAEILTKNKLTELLNIKDDSGNTPRDVAMDVENEEFQETVNRLVY